MSAQSFLGTAVFRGLEPLVEDMVENVFGTRFGVRSARSRPRDTGEFRPNVDVHETDGEMIVVVELAGVDPSTVRIDVDGDEVAISGERRVRVDPGSDDGADALRIEIP